MNPMEWLKAIYETFGSPYPRISLIAVAILGAISFAAVWLFAAKQVEKGRAVTSQPPTISAPVSTAGNNSPANSGSGNNFQYDQSSDANEKKAKPQQ